MMTIMVIFVNNTFHYLAAKTNSGVCSASCSAGFPVRKTTSFKTELKRRQNEIQNELAYPGYFNVGIDYRLQPCRGQ
jgi:hypothetical protein